MADSSGIGAIAVRDSAVPEHLEAAHSAGFRNELKFELLRPAASIGLVILAAVAGIVFKPWLAPVLLWLGA